jgi:cation-transporting ATPase E
MNDNRAQETQPRGLTSVAVAERVARGQVNRVRRSNAADYAAILRRNTLTAFNALVVPAAIALFSLHEYRGALAVSGMAITNSLLGLIQEIRAKRHLDRLALLAETRVRVLRDGQVREIPAGDVVQDDFLLLSAGDAVVADGTVLEARFLEVDEALLTGESDPVQRHAGDTLLSGSFCVAGDGVYRADRVGKEAFAQRTTLEARRYHFAASPLQRSIDRLIGILTITAIVLCAAYILFFFLHPFPKLHLVDMIAATITSMVPQGLVLMTTLAFTLGAVRMSYRGAVVQNLNAVESMAAVNTLCLDKTGTLTTNNLRFERLQLVTAALSEDEVRQRLRLFVSMSPDHGSKNLAAFRASLGESPGELLDALPFKAQNRYSAVRVRAANREHVLVLGACEALLPLLTAGAAQVEAAWKDLRHTGLRLLLFAEADEAQARPFAGSLDGFHLAALALLGLSDELRPEATAVLQALAEQDIAFKVISGDNPPPPPATVAPLAAGADRLEALIDTPVATGADLEQAADPAELIRACGVFGRVTPWQKVQIVEALQAQGRNVAMIGDGVNDVLPIKKANLGIALGAGSRAARTVAGLVLETNDFGLLPTTLDEGRTILRNLRRAGKLFLTKNAYVLVLIVGTVGVLQLPFPFLPQQVTLLNFLTIGLPALVIALGRERAAAATRVGFLREVGGFAIRSGVVIGFAGLAVMELYRRWVPGADPLLLRTLLLSVLILLGLITLLRALTDGEKAPLTGDRTFYFLAGAAVVAYLIALYWPAAAYFFELQPLNGPQWLWVLAVVLAAALLLRLSDRRAKICPSRARSAAE